MFHQPLWMDFLDRLSVRAQARFSVFAFRTTGEDVVTELYGSSPPPAEMQRQFAQKYVPGSIVYHNMREARVYSLEDLLDLSDLAHRKAILEYLQSEGLTSLRAVRVTEASGVDTWLTCLGGKEVGPAAGALLTSLVPHLRIAMRAFVALQRERFRSSVTSEAFGRLNFGWFTLDSQCRIIDMTPHAEQLFERTTLLRRGRYNRLMPASASVDRKIAELVRGFTENSGGRAGAFNLSRDPWLDILVTPVKDYSISTSTRPVAIAYLSGDRWSHADRCEQLTDLFGLLPSEARLAWAIVRGMSITEAAAELGITVETARTYSKQIYGKTGARGQADLIRTVLTSVLALA
jgi:DNA-binding CsgD family transcriptional regulator